MIWLKENWFKLIGTLAILAISSSLVYYYVIYIPQKDKLNKELQEKERLAENQSKCKDVGDKIYKAEQIEYQQLSGYAFEPTYKFNTNLGTCLYSGGGYTSTNSWERFVLDTETNQKLVVSNNFDVKAQATEQETKSRNDYWDKEHVLMN